MAIPIYVAACAVPDGGLFRAERFRDVHLYQGFANAVLDGRVPYRDFFMEYPPGALTVFLPPAAFGSSHYNATFKCLMVACGIATLLLLAFILVRLGVSTSRLWGAVLLFALSPLALGPISLNTYDAWPALLTVAAFMLLLARQDVAAFALLGAAFAAKVYPVVLIPPAAVFVWRTHGRQSALRALAASAGVAALIILPFLIVAPHGLAESFRAQASRSLQVESLGGSLLAAGDRLGLYSATVVHRTGHAISYDLVGSLPETLAVLSSVAQVLAVISVAWLYLRGRDDPRRLALAFAAAVAGFLAFTRFFSPQYLVWLVPFVLLLEPAAWVLTAAALVLAQVWFFHYSDVFALGGYVWLVFVRDLLVAALFALALVRLRRSAPEDEYSVLLEHEPPLRVPS
ncbi:MAG: glycosyltransferase 87 family protein [Actinomycetota bacterium]|nr:glycosyltransferase 87 family protein [Actinomycetota bacterium]